MRLHRRNAEVALLLGFVLGLAGGMLLMGLMVSC